MNKSPLRMISLIALLIGLNVAAPSAIAMNQADDPDEVAVPGDNDDERDGVLQNQDAADLPANGITQASIFVGPSASGEAVRILRTGYTLQPLTNACPDCIGIVVGRLDLSNPRIIARLQAAYEARQPVGLTNATPASIQRLHDLLGHRGSAKPAPGSVTVDLVVFRKALRTDGQLHSSSHMLLPRMAAPTAKHLRKRGRKEFARLPKRVKRKLRRRANRFEQQQQMSADEKDLRALKRIFSATPRVPKKPPSGGPQQNLLELAESYESSCIQSDSFGDQVQLINTVWAARSFMNQADLYYVLQETDYHVVPTVLFSISHPFPLPLNSWNNSVSSLPITGQNPTIIQPSPQTTMEATQDVSSTSFNIGGSIGWQQTMGVNASVTGGVTITNQKITTIPPINITNDAILSLAQTYWTYDVNELPKQEETIDLFSQWIWSIPFASYGATQTLFQFSSTATLQAKWRDIFIGNVSTSVSTPLSSEVPIPFGHTFTLQPPVVTGLSASSVEIGTPFTIEGTGFYPSLVQSVLIGGTPVSADNITTVSDTQINIIAPNTGTQCTTGCTVAVQTTQGTSNTNFTIKVRSAH